MIRLRGIVKLYRAGSVIVPALRGVDLDIERGEFVSIIGSSGSGKSTLMNIIGCLDRFTRGTYHLAGHDVSALSDDQLAFVRGRQIGFVFQSFNLLRRLSALEQVEMPLTYRGGSDHRRRALKALHAVGLIDRMQHKPNQLSGGQQQRVAIARALVGDPSVILADEPTGALDTRTTADVMDIFVRLNRERGITVIFVTHEPEVAAYTNRVITLRDGLVVSDVASREARTVTQPPETARPRTDPAPAVRPLRPGSAHA
ncbi:MAG: ABC transporter ATP-binding protein [Dehalococcoidia bacterium]